MLKKLFRNLNIWLLFINLFCLQAYLIRFKVGPYPTNLQEILICALALAFLIHVLLEGKIQQIFRNIKKHWIITTLILLSAVSLMTTSPINDIYLFRHIKFLVFASILGFIFLETFQEEKDRTKAINIMGFGALVFGIFSVIYNLLGYNIAHDYRLTGPLESAVMMSFYLTPFFLYFLVKFLENQKNKSSLLGS